MTARIDFRWWDRRLALKKYAKQCNGQTLLVKTTDVWFPYFLSNFQKFRENSKKFQNFKKVQNDAKQIFYPDSFEKYPSILGADGRVSWRMAFTLELACDMNVAIFPFGKILRNSLKISKNFLKIQTGKFVQCWFNCLILGLAS